MVFKSRNDKFIVSIPDTVKTDEFRKGHGELEEKIDMKLQCLDNRVTMADVADTIFGDLFCSNEWYWDEKIIKCTIINERGVEYPPLLVDFRVSAMDVLRSVAEQWFL